MPGDIAAFAADETRLFITREVTKSPVAVKAGKRIS